MAASLVDFGAHRAAPRLIESFPNLEWAMLEMTTCHPPHTVAIKVCILGQRAI